MVAVLETPAAFLLASLPSPPHPAVFKAGPFVLSYYGLFVALGIVVATWLTERELARKGYKGVLAIEALFFVVPSSLAGARFSYVATNYDLYANNPIPSVLEVWGGGVEIYGGVVGGCLGLWVFARLRGIGPLAFADAAAPGVILGQAIGRWGDYFNQELFGKPSDLPWAIRIAPDNRPAEFADAALFHPTFLYESIWDVLVCLILLWVVRRFADRLKDGDVFLLYVSLYSLGHFFVGTLRVDPAFIIGGIVRVNLLLSCFLALSFAMILFSRHALARRKRFGAH